MRTQDEIVARIAAVKDADFFGFEQEPLLVCLDFDHAKPFLKPDVTAEQWPKGINDAVIRADAISYLAFAWTKAEDHRGISASRSVSKMRSYCWLLGFDMAEYDAAGYAQYGCPKLAVAARLLGQPLPDDLALVRMMNGDSCGLDDCGCGG